MKKSKLYTGEEDVIVTDKHGNKTDKKMEIGSTLHYGKDRAKTTAEERDEVKRQGFTIHDGTFDNLVKQKIKARKDEDTRNKLNVHEAYENGLITENEKYELLRFLSE